MSKIKIKQLKMTMTVDYNNGLTESVSGNPCEIASRFANLVTASCGIYCDGLRRVSLYDSANHLFKVYEQKF